MWNGYERPFPWASHIFRITDIFFYEYACILHFSNVFCRTQLNLKEPQLGQDDEMNQFEEVKL